MKTVEQLEAEIHESLSSFENRIELARVELDALENTPIENIVEQYEEIKTKVSFLA